MPSVAFAYNGSDTVTATITGAVVGHSYTMSVDAPGATSPNDFAVSTTLVLTCTNVSGVDPEKYWLYVTDDTDVTFIDAALIRYGHTGTHAQVADVSYDGANTVTLVYPTDIGISGYWALIWKDGDGSVNPFFASDGTTQTHNIDISSIGASPGDVLFINLESNSSPFGNWIDGVSLVIVYGTPFSVTGTQDWYDGVPVPTPPANDDFVNAKIITGASGSDIPINTILATKETGEPNAFLGGKTVWWKWTAPADGFYFFQGLLPSPADISTTGIGIYTGTTVSGLTTIARSYDTYNFLTPDQDHIQVFFYATAGTDYYIQFNDGNSVGQVTLSWGPEVGPVPTMEFIESITGPFKVYPGGVIAIRAADFISSARAGLSVVPDSTTNIGTAVQESQKITFVGLGGSPPGSLEANNQTMFANASPTIEIPWNSITCEIGQNYDVYIRFKLTGGRASSRPWLSGLYTASADVLIGSLPSTSTSPSDLSSPYDQLKETPFWQYMQSSNWSGIATSGESIIIKALQADDNDAVFLIDQVILVPLGNNNKLADELSVWWGGSGDPPSVPVGFSSDPRAGDYDDWVGGKFSVIEANTYDISNHATGDVVSEFQKKTSAAVAEFTAGGIGKIQWDGYADFILTGVGIVGLPDYVHFFHDDFARTIAADSGWGIKDLWQWIPFGGIFVTPYGLSVDGTRGIVTSTANFSSFAFTPAIFGGGTTSSKSRDFNTAFGLKVEATVGWDTGVAAGMYVACIGEAGSSGVSGGDKDYFGFAVVKSGSTFYGVIIQYNSTTYTGIATAGNIRELSSRVALSGTQPLDVVVTRKGQYIEATFEGNTISAYKSAILFGGGYPYPNRRWEDYPYPTDLSIDPTYSFYGIDPKDSGSPCFANLFGITASGTWSSYLYDYQLSLLQFGTQPSTAKLRIENQDNSSIFNEITLHDNAFQMISFPTGVYGGSYADTNLIAGHYDFGFFAFKSWLPVGSAELSRIEFYSTYFRQAFGPLSVNVKSIFWFYKDGAWHMSGDSSNTHDLYLRKDGSWQLHPTSTVDKLYGQLSATWQN